MRKWQIIFPFFLIMIVSCASSYKVVEMPLRDADLYPLSHARTGVAIAVDEISDPDRAMRYFGADLVGNGILAVDVLVSNFSDERWAVGPADILLRRGDEVIDPLPVEWVADLVKKQGDYNEQTRKQIEAYIKKLSMKDRVVLPNDNYHGVMFFPIQTRRERNEFFSTIPLFIHGLKLHMIATNLDTGDRNVFGPFTVYDGIRMIYQEMNMRW